MTEIDLYRPRELAVLPRPTAAITERDVVDGWVKVVTKIAKLADMIADTEFVPKALRNKPAAITACMLTGREIGVGPMISMKVIHMVNGSPSLAAEYKRARALDAGHEIVYEDTTLTRCVVRGRRKGEDTWVTVTWTIEDAKRAKLLNKDVWQQNPRRMLEARATGELCDLKFPDCSWGLATTEALQDGDTAEFDDMPVPEQAAIEAPAPRTAQRRRPATTVPPKPDPTPVSAAASASGPGATPQAAPAQTARQTRTDDGLPPLPGEDEDPTPAPTAATPDAGPARPGTDDNPAKASSGQRGIIHQHFKRLGFGDDEREQRLTATAVIAGLDDLATTNDLTSAQAKVVIDTLARCKDRERLIALLAATEKQGSDG